MTTRASFVALMNGREWIWIAGNHDPLSPGIGGRVHERIAVGPLILRHVAGAGAAPVNVRVTTIPRRRWRSPVGASAARCFVGTGRRLILPAFGAYTGGLDVFDPALTRADRPRLCGPSLGRAQVHASLPGA